MAEGEGVAVETDDFFAQQFFPVDQGFGQFVALSVAGNQKDGFVLRHQITRLLPWDFDHAVAAEDLEMGKVVGFFAVFFADPIQCRL